MSMLLKIAFRNVFRNRRRTAINIVMIAGAISAIVIFKGFSHHLISRLEDVAVNNQYGHLQIASDKTWNLSSSDKPRDRLVAVDPSLKEKVLKLPKVEYMSGRLSFYGLVNTGDQSQSARGLGFDPSVETKMRDQLKIVEGRNLSANSKFEVLLGSGLQHQLGVKVGDQLTLLSYTFDGAVNAIDAECVGVFQVGLQEVDDTTFFLPLATSQKLMDTTAVERWVVQLTDTSATDMVAGEITKIAATGTSVRTWYSLAMYYRQMSSYLTKQNTIINWILLVLALLAIGNTVGMSVAERMGEIGTLRALGDNRNDIITQFLVESLVLGGLGGLAGVVMGTSIAKVLTWSKIMILAPGASIKVPVVIDLLPSAFLYAIAMMCLMAIVATLIPAFRASQLKIVDALRRNI